jgi:hypothetical protein
MLDDLTFFVLSALILWAIMADFTPINAQLDATLATMSNAVAALKAHVDNLSTLSGNNDATTIAAICQRLKAGTDQLDAAIAAARASLAS